LWDDRNLRVLAVNSGSSSLKHLLAEVGQDHRIAERLSEGKVEAGGGRHPVQELLDHLRRQGLLEGLQAVGHRVVHGGGRFVDPVAVDERVLADLDALSELAPLHNPPAVAGIREALTALPGVPEVAVFDTAFHAHMPPTGALYAVPRDWGVRRYGFHGLAHRWQAERYAQLAGRPLADLRLITLQLGSGCSAAAIAGGRSIDTSMGLTPTEGLVMATRSGDVDPTLVQFVSQHSGRSPESIVEHLNEQSGLLALGGSADMRRLLRATDAQGREAIDVFAYRARKYVGAYMAVLGGVDAVVFGGGVGEASPEIRRRILGGMEWLGIELDTTRNQARTSGEGLISAAGSAIAVHVIPDDEQALICRDTAALVGER
jgi:acetate kinase